MTLLLFLTAVALGQAEPAPAATTTPAPAAAPTAAEAPVDVDYTANRPPPAAWEKPQGSADGEADGEQGRSFTGQMVYTLLMLLAIIGLIYLVGKLGLWRFGGLRSSGSGKRLKIIDRVQLSARQALVLVEVADGPTLLLASSEGNVTVVARLPEGEQAQNNESFAAVMQRTADPQQRTAVPDSDGKVDAEQSA